MLHTGSVLLSTLRTFYEKEKGRIKVIKLALSAKSFFGWGLTFPWKSTRRWLIYIWKYNVTSVFSRFGDQNAPSIHFCRALLAVFCDSTRYARSHCA